MDTVGVFNRPVRAIWPTRSLADVHEKKTNIDKATASVFAVPVFMTGPSLVVCNMVWLFVSLYVHLLPIHVINLQKVNESEVPVFE